MKSPWSLIVIGMAVASPPAFAQGTKGPGSDLVVKSQDTEAQEQEASRKGELADAILAARQTATGREFGTSLWSSLKQSLLTLPVDRLEAFLSEGGLGNIEAAVRETAGPKVVGDTAADLAFTPVAPCRIIDTRSAAAGILVAGTQRSFLVRNAGGFASQGGSPTDCGIPATATSVEMNFVAVGPAGPGDLRAFAFGGTLPSASVINYSNVPGLNIANGIAQPVCNPATTTCTNDMTIRTDVSNTHLVVDVVGYFRRIDASVLMRAISAQPTVNTSTTPFTANLITGVVAPTAGGLLINVSFTCVSFNGTTDTRWDIQPRVDGTSSGSSMPLAFTHGSVPGTPGDSAMSTVFQPVAAGNHTISYQASRSNGDGSLDCNIHASSLFVPFNNAGGTP